MTNKVPTKEEGVLLEAIDESKDCRIQLHKHERKPFSAMVMRGWVFVEPGSGRVSLMNEGRAALRKYRTQKEPTNDE